MPQSPFLVDALQIEPGSGDTLTLSRDSAEGAMKFVDPIIPGGAFLQSLVGLRNITGLFIVGREGDGSPYTTIQDALDAVPDASSAALPSVVLVSSGVYQENVTIQKDGVFLVSLGGAKIINDGASDTVTISASLDTTPLKIWIQGLEIECTEDSLACIKVEGADSFATGTVVVNTAPLAAGDTLTIGGTTLTGVASARTSGSNNFATTGGTVAAVAAEIAAALNDTSNSFAETIEASVAGDTITIEAVVPGSEGNAITLVTLTDPVGGLTESGATLTGGGSAGSLVASQGLTIVDCSLYATGVGTYQVDADTSNDIVVRGGTWRGSSSTSLGRVVNCSSFRVFGVEWTNDFNMSYDTGADQPLNDPDAYEFKNCSRVGLLTVNLEGDGLLGVTQCSSVGGVTLGGDQTFLGGYSGFGDLDLSGTVTVSLSHCSRADLTLGGGTPTLEETSFSGLLDFAASDEEVVAFDIPQPDTNYRVFLDSSDPGVVLAVSLKATDSFTISSSAAFTGAVGYLVVRPI